MRLHRVEIKNFRSIEDATIEFEPRCRILVGMNDTGKSNVLKALSILKKGTVGQENDQRQEVAAEENEDFYIEAIFIPDEHDYEEIKNILLSRIYDPNSNIVDKILLFMKIRNLQYHLIDYLDGEGKNEHIEWDGPYSFKGFKLSIINRILENFKGYKKRKNIIPDNIYAAIRENIMKTGTTSVRSAIDSAVKISTNIKNLIKCDFIKSEDIASFPDSIRDAFWENVSEEEIINTIDADIEQWIKKELNIIVWNPGDAKHKITGNVQLEEFTKNLSDFCFMRNVFRLHESSISSFNDNKEIDDVFVTKFNKYKDTNRLIQGYLSDVNGTLNNKFKKIWQHYYCNLEGRGKDMNFAFHLNYNNPNLHFEIREFDKKGKKTFNDIERRSEGFKKFTEFLLIISSEFLRGDVSNTLFIIDEPEASLHPSAARDFRDQLIGISEKLENYVVYGTHAISMTDRKNLNRHYIIERENRITSVKPAEKVQREKRKLPTGIINLSRGIVEQEILFQSIGGSLYQDLQEKNIIFEGWTDKHLFNKYCEGNEIKNLNFGVSHVFGVDTFYHVTPILELGERDVIIVTDCDKGALNAQEKYNDSHGYGRWFTYREIDDKISAITAEDFLKKEFIAEQVNSYIENENLTKKDSDFSVENFNIAKNNSNFTGIKIWLKKNLHNEFSDEEIHNIAEKIKHQIFNNLKYENILEQEYLKLYKGIVNKINNNQTQAPDQGEPTSSSAEKATPSKTKSKSSPPPTPPTKNPPPTPSA